MFIVFISRLRRRIMFVMRLAFILAIVIILIGQLLGLVKNGFLQRYQDDRPSGNPMRVEAVSLDQQKSTEAGPLNGLVQILKDYYRGNRK